MGLLTCSSSVPGHSWNRNRIGLPISPVCPVHMGLEDTEWSLCFERNTRRGLQPPWEILGSILRCCVFVHTAVGGGKENGEMVTL